MWIVGRKTFASNQIKITMCAHCQGLGICTYNDMLAKMGLKKEKKKKEEPDGLAKQKSSSSGAPYQLAL